MTRTYQLIYYAADGTLEMVRRGRGRPSKGSYTARAR